MREMAHTAAQNALQNRLMSGNVHDAIKISCWAFLSTGEPHRTARLNVWSWTSGSTQSGSRRGNGGHGRSSGPCRSRSQELTVRDASRGHQHGRIHMRVACWKQRLGNRVPSSSTFFLDIVSVLQVAYRHGADQRTELSDKRSPSLADYASDLEVCIATSFKLTLPSIFSGRATETSAVKGTTWTSQRETLGPPTSDIHSNRREREDYEDEVVLRGDHNVRSIGRDQVCDLDDARDERSVPGCAQCLLVRLYDELTNDENKTSGTEAWSLVCSIVRWMFDDIAVHRCLTRCVDIKSGVAVSSDEVPLSLVTGPSRYGRVYHARVPTPTFDRAVYQLSPVPSSNAVFGVQRNPEEIQ
jgi:hypothetical protein